jgi:hypothetical protein
MVRETTGMPGDVVTDVAADAEAEAATDAEAEVAPGVAIDTGIDVSTGVEAAPIGVPSGMATGSAEATVDGVVVCAMTPAAVVPVISAGIVGIVSFDGVATNAGATAGEEMGVEAGGVAGRAADIAFGSWVKTCDSREKAGAVLRSSASMLLRISCNSGAVDVVLTVSTTGVTVSAIDSMVSTTGVTTVCWG